VPGLRQPPPWDRRGDERELDWVPSQLRVARIRRPKYDCGSCGTIHLAPAPERLIANDLAPPELIARCWLANIATTRRSIDRPKSSPGMAFG